MSRYAVLDNNNIVINVIEISDESGFQLYDSVVKSEDANIGGTIKEGLYSPPVRDVSKTGDAYTDEIIAKVEELILLATSKIAPLQDAVDLGIATDAETASLIAWKTFRVLVNRVTSQTGYPKNIDWPQTPE